jgi:hypothetical protein
MAFLYEPKSHRYFLDGVRIPGITSVLTRAGILDTRWYTEEGCRRGTAVHMALQFAAEGDLNPASVHPSLVPYLDAFERFRVETGWEPTERPELAVYSETLRYATQIDGIGTMRGELWVLNWKTGAKQPWWAVQSAGEALAYVESTGRVPLFRATRGSLRLLADGTYRLEPHHRKVDYERFRAARVLAAYHEEIGTKEEEPTS